jgi:hypothetical protein
MSANTTDFPVVRTWFTGLKTPIRPGYLDHRVDDAVQNVFQGQWRVDEPRGIQQESKVVDFL